MQRKKIRIYTQSQKCPKEIHLMKISLEDLKSKISENFEPLLLEYDLSNEYILKYGHIICIQSFSLPLQKKKKNKKRLRIESKAVKNNLFLYPFNLFSSYSQSSIKGQNFR